MYSYIGFIAFVTPCAGSFGLALATRDGSYDRVWMNPLLSFSVVLMFLHMASSTFSVGTCKGSNVIQVPF